MNRSNMGLYFIKEIDGFKKEGEAHQPRQYQDNCQHNFSILSAGITQNRCPSWQTIYTSLIYKAIAIDSQPGRREAPCQNGRERIKMKKVGRWVGLIHQPDEASFLPRSRLVAEMIFVNFPVERGEADIQKTGGFRLVTLGVIENPLYMQLLHAGQVKC